VLEWLVRVDGTPFVGPDGLDGAGRARLVSGLDAIARGDEQGHGHARDGTTDDGVTRHAGRSHAGR
jgi:hypothetical protein